MDELFVRDFMEDRELTAWLLLDRSRSMAFGAAERTKERVLCELAAIFGQLLVRSGNRVGAIIYDGKDVWTIPPRQGRRQVLALGARAPSPGAAGARDRPQQAARHRGTRRASPVACRADLRLHQRAGMGAPAVAPDRTARGRRSSPSGSPRVRAPRCRAFVRRGRRDGRAIARRFERPGAPPPSPAPDAESRTRPSATASHGLAPTLHVVSTEDDLVSAFVRMAESGRKYRQMTFASPGWLIGVAAPAGGGRCLCAAAGANGGDELPLLPLRASSDRWPRAAAPWRLHVPFALFLAALALLVVASARPMATVKTPRREATVVLAIDVSNSMAAADVKPSRIGAAKLAAEDFVREQPSGVRHRRRGLRPQCRDRTTTHLRPRRRAARPSITCPWEVAPLWPRASSPRSTRSPARP